MWDAAQQLDVTLNRIKKGLVANQIEPGPDGKYSLADIVKAMSLRGLELKAREARWQGQIDEAEEAKLKREEARNRLIPRANVQDFTTDILLRLTQIIRHSKLSPQDQKRAIHELSSVQFKGGKLIPTNGSLAA